MVVELRNIGFVNKGAELMMLAMIQKIEQRYPGVKMVMAPTPNDGHRPFEKLTQLGLYPKAWVWRHSIQWGNLAGFMPKKLREAYGLVLDKEVNVVLDASGFTYSDYWGFGSSKELANSSKRWKKNKTKIILLPQAFGPFRENKIKCYVKDWVENVDLIFAREKDSYMNLTDLVGEQEKIKIFPDFTNILNGTLPEGYDLSNKRVALVPNYRMIDKTKKKDSETYLPFMISCAKYLVERESKPFMLVHEGANDRKLAELISEAVGGIPIVKEVDPLRIKGILGSCDATIGSRFHGLVNALSQGVPSLATGWSHKYTRLFEDYEFSNGLVSVFDEEIKVHQKIDMLLDPDLSKLFREKLKKKSEEMKKKSEKMWNMVFELIEQ